MYRARPKQTERDLDNVQRKCNTINQAIDLLLTNHPETFNQMPQAAVYRYLIRRKREHGGRKHLKSLRIPPRMKQLIKQYTT